MHLTGRQAGEYAARAGVGQLLLTHLVPWNDQERTLAEATGPYDGPLLLASSGLVLGPGTPLSAGSGTPLSGGRPGTPPSGGRPGTPPSGGR